MEIIIYTFITVMVFGVIFLIEHALDKKKNSETINDNNTCHLKERINTIVPGTILYKVTDDCNPFLEEVERQILILDVKENKKGIFWAKYCYESPFGGFNNWSPFYSEIETLLRLYPNIKLPK